MSRLDLGVGLVVFPDLLPLLDDLDDVLDVYEVEPQTYWLPTGGGRERWRFDHATYDAIATRGKPVLAHGVSAPVGGAALPDPTMVESFARSVELLGAVAASEHLATNTIRHQRGSIETGVFMPPCPTAAGVERAAAAVSAYQAVLDVPFGVETGVNYLAPRDDELADSEIVRRVVGATGCGIVLDLHNLWCNERNGRETVADALANLPLADVTEVHLAGGFELGGFYLDAHSGATPPPVLEIAAAVLPSLVAARAVVFEVLPAFVWRVGLDPLRAHLAALGDLVRAARTASSEPERPAAVRPTIMAEPVWDAAAVQALTDADAERRQPGTGCAAGGERTPPTPDDWDAGLAQAVTGVDLGARLFEDEPGIGVMRRIVDSGRRGRLVSAARTTMRLLMISIPGEAMDAVLDAYCRARPPALWGHDEAHAFLDWAESNVRLPVARLADAIAVDRALMRHAVDGEPQHVLLDGDPHELAAALAVGRVPTTTGQPTLATIG